MMVKKPESPEYAEYASQGAYIAKKANKLFLDAMLSDGDSENGDYVDEAMRIEK